MKSTSRVTWQSVFTAVMYGFMYFPIIVLAVYSFNASRFSANWEGFSLKWYRSLFSDTRIFLAPEGQPHHCFCGGRGFLRCSAP